MSRITEQIATVWGSLSWTGLRSRFKITGSKFFSDAPRYDNTTVNFTTTRELYSNIGDNTNLGGFFAKPIVDLQVDFIGTPTASTGNPDLDDFLNESIQSFWFNELQQMLRNSIRDSKTFVRIQQDDFENNPLMSFEDTTHCRLFIVDPERVVIEYDPTNSQVISKATIKHEIEMVEEDGDIEQGVMPKMKKHEIFETITPEDFTYFDKTDMQELTTWNQPNIWGFVPIVEVFNEYESTMSGGQSELETVYPLIRAFHDCLTQSLQAHKYHSIPKVKLKIQDVQPFIKNNFPDALNADGRIIPGSTISWKGKEIIFLQAEEDAEFLEAKSVLGDSKILADFIIDCIAVASETPRWAFMILDAGSANQANNAQTLPWTKKIIRKRESFTPYIQQLLKMLMVINDFAPERPKVSWEIVRVEDQAAHNQALQQLIMGLEVAAQRQIISDSTYRELLRQFIPNMKNPAQEALDALKNKDMNPPSLGNSNGAGNVPISAGPQGKHE